MGKLLLDLFFCLSCLDYHDFYSCMSVCTIMQGSNRTQWQFLTKCPTFPKLAPPDGEQSDRLPLLFIDVLFHFRTGMQLFQLFKTMLQYSSTFHFLANFSLCHSVENGLWWTNWVISDNDIKNRRNILLHFSCLFFCSHPLLLGPWSVFLLRHQVVRSGNDMMTNVGHRVPNYLEIASLKNSTVNF